MNDKKKQIDLLPEEFESYEAAEFWDAHDTTDYADDFETVEAETELKRRRYEVEIDADLIPALSEYSSLMVYREAYQELHFNQDYKNKWLIFIDRFTRATMRIPEGVSLENLNAVSDKTEFTQVSHYQINSSQSNFYEAFRTSTSFRTGGLFKTGGSWKGDLESWRTYFSNYKNYWFDWDVKKF